MTTRFAVGLARASSDKQETSTADQRAAIERWARGAGLDLVRVFEDDGVSGSVLDRPGLTALMAHVEAHPGGGVVALWRRNRLARPDDPLDGLLLERRIERAGWRLHYLQGANRTGDAFVDGLVGYVEHHAAGQFLKTLAVDTLNGQMKRVLSGSCNGNRTPYGYRRVCVAEDGTQRVVARTAKHRRAPGERVTFAPGDPAEVDTVRWLFDEVAGGRHSTVSAAHALNARGVPSPSGGRWIDETVRRIVASAVYCGDLVWNRRAQGKFAGLRRGEVRLDSRARGRPLLNDAEDVVTVRGHHEPLVDRETWARANATLRARGQVRGHARYVRRAHPLSGRVVCGACGATMRVTARGKRDSERAGVRYMCKSPKVSGTCACYAIGAEVLERAVLRRLRETLLPMRAQVEARVATILRERFGAGATSTELGELRREADALSRKVEQGIENLALVGGEAARRLAAKVAEWQGRLGELQRHLGAAEAARAQAAHVGDATAEVMALFDDLATIGPDAPADARRLLFARTVAEVEVHFETERRREGGKARHRARRGRVHFPKALVALVASMCAGSTIVVTSYYHVPRTRLAFERVGVPRVATARAAYRPALRDVYSLPREVVGLAWYRVRSV
ncbi:MAG: recombinase family protein [Planctomycetota bacterium]|nr:recombinase family protein [Planctomycetota bacterium]